MSHLTPSLKGSLGHWGHGWVTRPLGVLLGNFVHSLLVALETADMPETPLLYMTRSLSVLPPSPLLGPASLLVLRYTLYRGSGGMWWCLS